jgi:HAD superfamily hydrolase (TIGR01549 family)
MTASSAVRGIIFDLDDTLVASGLDFQCMRREMELPPGLPILEALAAMPEPRASLCRAILHRHEQAGADRATTLPGVREFLSELADRGIHTAVFSRNSHALCRATLNRLELPIELVIGREDAPPKPDPAGIWKICETWGLHSSQVLMIGDFDFDIEAGRRAGARTVFVSGGIAPEPGSIGALADFCLSSFAERQLLLDWLDKST